MANALAGSKSPFLLHGAKQPVNWLPWGRAAFERAQSEDKPILLDIGAVWCHWCHVMDRESYENHETAALINEHFIPVKVDRDERPDVDARYQRAVQSLVGQGGWPLTAVLTPTGETYYGGTYFPPEDGYGRPSFKRVLREVSRIWRDDRARALEAARGIKDRLAQFAQAETQPGEIDARLIEATVEEFAQNFDFRHGGFGRAPKFPNAGGLLLLLDHDLDTGLAWTRRMVQETLHAMTRGGIYDQIGGGFHRYSVDARWIVPHFEKMAYDNGPLLVACARAAAVYEDREMAAAARGIVAHYEDIAADLLAAGGFPASQDADFSPDDDGDYWTWTVEEIEAALGDESQANTFMLHYGVNDPGSRMHLDPSRHVLFLARQPADAATAQSLDDARAKLKHARDQRPQPFVDRSVYTGWSALVASGFFTAARYLGEHTAGDHALRALQRIWTEGFHENHGLAHRLGDRDAGEQLEDHAHMADALLDAFEYSQEPVWVERAIALVDHVEHAFRHASGGYSDRPAGAEALTAGMAEPTMSVADSPVPSGNGTMALALLRLAALTGRTEYSARALRVLVTFAGSAPRLGTSAATYVRALSWATQPVTTIAVVGNVSPAQDALFAIARSTYVPRSVLRWLRAGEDAVGLPEEARAMMTGEPGRAYVCRGTHCFAPVSSPDELRALLQTSNASETNHANA